MNRESVTVKTEVVLEKYYVLRGINVNINGVKTVIKEKEIELDPFTNDATEEIAQMLVDNPEVTFCSVVENYRLLPTDLPFV